jgi:hypothetical protein
MGKDEVREAAADCETEAGALGDGTGGWTGCEYASEGDETVGEEGEGSC